MDLATGSNLWALTGTVYALAGAALMWATSFATPLMGSALKAAETASQRLDARFGAGLLTAGLFLQATGTASNSAVLHKSAVFMLLGLAMGLLMYALAKDMMIVDATAETTSHPVPMLEVTPEAAKPTLIAAADETLEIEDQRTVQLRQRS